MTVAAAAAKAGPYTGNDSASAFAFSFKVFADADIRVVETVIATEVETDLVLNTNYTVSRNVDQDNNPGGTITYKVGGVTTALPSTKKITIVGDFDYEQPTDIPNGGAFFANVIENALDRVTMLVKQQQEKLDRAAVVPVSSSYTVEDLSDDLITLAAIEASITTVAGISANVTTVAGVSADVTTVAGIAANVTTVAGVAADVTAVAALDPTDLGTVADNVTDITNFSDVYQGAKAADPALRNNGNALQAGDLYFNTADDALRVYSGTVWVAGTAGTVSVQQFSGDGVETVFSLAAAPASENNTQVYLSGVYQQKSEYGVSGTTLTFSAAPPAGTNNIEVVTIATLALGETDASLVSYTPAGTGAVATTAQAKLRESVSVEDFGAVGDGVTDDSAAINAAIVAVNAAGGGVVNLDALNYAVATPVYMLSDVTLRGKGSGSTTITQIGSAASWDAIAVSSGIITTLAAAEYNDIHVIGLKLQGLYTVPIPDGAATYAVDGISIANAWNSSIEDCLVEDTSTAISFYGTVTGVVHYNNFISGCTVRDIQSWDAAGNSGTPRGILMNTSSSTVENCIAESAYTGFYVSDDYGNYVNCRASRWTDDGFYVNANYCTFTNCYAIGNTTRAGASGSGFAVNPSTGHTFTGCVALRCPNSGMRFRHAAATAPYMNRVIGCWFSDCGYGFFDDMTDADPYPDAMAYGNVFIGNIADNNQNNGFIFIHQQSGVIQGNEAVDNNQAGATVNTRGGIGLAEYCIDNVIQGNICRDTQGVPTQVFGLYSYPASVTGASIENTGNRFDHKSVTGTDVFFPTTQEGTSAATVISGTRGITGSVVFGKTFEAAPTVVLTVQTATALADAERPVSVTAYNITTTGFSYVIDTFINVAANRAITVGWTAVNL
jgi:hypothetical protein